MKLLGLSPVVLLLLLRISLASPTPVIERSISAPSEVSAPEESQDALLGLALGAYGPGFFTGRWKQSRLDRERFTPGLDGAAGRICFRSGSWSPNGSIRRLATAACQNLVPHALDFEKYGDSKRTNPNVAFFTNLDGSPLINSEGYQQEIIFGMLDQNGKKGAANYTQPACELAITSLLRDCNGDDDDTRGGIYAYGRDRVAAYSIDPTCVDSLRKKCGAHI